MSVAYAVVIAVFDFVVTGTEMVFLSVFWALIVEVAENSPVTLLVLLLYSQR